MTTYSVLGSSRHSLTERRAYDKIQAAYDRASDRLFRLLPAMVTANAEGYRNWHEGVPAHWVAEQLTYADAMRPLSEPLSVTPPCAYGYTTPIK